MAGGSNHSSLGSVALGGKVRSIMSSLVALNMVFAIALAVVVATDLDNQPGSPSCLLTKSDNVCTFAYITVGQVTLVGSLILIPIIWLAFVHRSSPDRPEPRILEYAITAALFSFFWQFVFALVIQIRGSQANDAGLKGESARTAAWALAWLGVAMSALVAGVLVAKMMVRWWESQRKIKAEISAPLQKKLSVVHEIV